MNVASVREIFREELAPCGKNLQHSGSVCASRSRKALGPDPTSSLDVLFDLPAPRLPCLWCLFHRIAEVNELDASQVLTAAPDVSRCHARANHAVIIKVPEPVSVAMI